MDKQALKYQEQIDIVTESNRQLIDGIGEAKAESSRLAEELERAEGYARKFEAGYNRFKELFGEQQIIIREFKESDNRIGEYSNTAGEGIRDAIEGIDNLIEEIQTGSDS